MRRRRPSAFVRSASERRCVARRTEKASGSLADEIAELEAKLREAKAALPGVTDGEKQFHARVTEAYREQSNDIVGFERSVAYQMAYVQMAAASQQHAAWFRWEQDFKELTTFLEALYITIGDGAWQLLRGPGNQRVDRAERKQPDTWNHKDFAIYVPSSKSMQSYLPVIDPKAGEQFATPKDIAALQSCWDAKYSGRTRRHMEKAGILAFDGMFLVKGFYFSKREGKFVGRVKGTTDEEVLSGMAIPEGELANEAIQLFWISHCGKVQVPMGFHFVRAVDPDDLAKRLFEAYVRIEAAGFITLGGVTDGATVMKSTQDALKKLVEETTAGRTGTEYDALIDYDHWLKSARGGVWHNDLYNGRGVADGDGHFFSFETLKNLKGSKVAAVRELFAHLTTADLEPSVDEMDTQLALNVVDAETIAGLEEVVRMLTAKKAIGAEAKLAEVESLCEYLTLLGNADSAFRKNKPFAEIEAALKAFHEYMRDNAAIVAGLNKNGESVRLETKAAWDSAAKPNSDQRYESAGPLDFALDDDGEVTPGKVAFMPVAELGDSTVVLAARSIRMRGKSPPPDRLEYLVRNSELNDYEPTWVPAAALAAITASLPTPRQQQQRVPTQTRNLLSKLSRDSLAWNLQGFRNVTRRLAALAVGTSRPRYWSTNRVENHNSLHRYKNKHENCQQYANFDAKATLLMMIQNLMWFPFGKRRTSYAMTADAESDGSSDDDDEPKQRMSLLKKKRRAPVSEGDDEVIDLVAPTSAQKDAYAKAEHSRTRASGVELKKIVRKVRGPKGAAAPNELEPCPDDAHSCRGSNCGSINQRATSDSIGAALKQASKQLPPLAMVTCADCQSVSMHLQCLGKTVRSQARQEGEAAICNGTGWLCTQCKRKVPKAPKVPKVPAEKKKKQPAPASPTK